LHAIDPTATARKRTQKATPARTSLATFGSTNSMEAQPDARGRARRGRRRTFPPFEAKKARLQVRSILHGLDHLRPSQAYWQVRDVAGELEEIRSEAEARLANGDVDPAFEQLGVLTDEVRLAWTFLDDSDGFVGDFARDLGKTWIRWLLHPNVPPVLRRRYTAALERWQKTYDDYGVGAPFAAAAIAGRHEWDIDGPPELVAVKLDLLESSGADERFLALALRAGKIRRYALCQIRRGEVDAALAVFDGATFDDRDVLAVAEALLAAKHRERAFAFAIDAARQPVALMRTGWNAFDGRSWIANWVAENAEQSGDADVSLAAAELAFGLHVDVEQYRRIERLSGPTWVIRREALLERARSCKANEASAAIAVLVDADRLDDAQRLFDARRGIASDATMWRLFVRAAELSPTWTIERASRYAEGIMDRVERNRYEIAVRWLRIVAFAFRSDSRDVDWVTYREALLVKHKAKRALIPLIRAMR
jgi:hypothetical protein